MQKINSNKKKQRVNPENKFSLASVGKWYSIVQNDMDKTIKFTSVLILWTEKGASRMCKILDTDRAWERFFV